MREGRGGGAFAGSDRRLGPHRRAVPPPGLVAGLHRRQARPPRARRERALDGRPQLAGVPAQAARRGPHRHPKVVRGQGAPLARPEAEARRGRPARQRGHGHAATACRRGRLAPSLGPRGRALPTRRRPPPRPLPDCSLSELADPRCSTSATTWPRSRPSSSRSRSASCSASPSPGSSRTPTTDRPEPQHDNELTSRRRANARADIARRAEPGRRGALRGRYPALMESRLEGKNVAVVFLGPVDGERARRGRGRARRRRRRQPRRADRARHAGRRPSSTRALKGDEELARYADERRRLRRPRRRPRPRARRGRGDASGGSCRAARSRSGPGRRRRRSTPSSSSPPGRRRRRRRTTGQRRRPRRPSRLLDGLVGGLTARASRSSASRRPRRSRVRSTSTATQGVSSVDDVDTSAGRSRSRCSSPAARAGPLRRQGLGDRRRRAADRPCRLEDRWLSSTVLVPARNEEERIGETVRRLSRASSRTPR